MFNTPLSEIDFDQVVAFCKGWPEGVRVEYKEEPTNIPKVVSSFANTSGGIWVIGVKIDNRNLPILPLYGYSSRPGIEEQITQSSYQGTYPPIIPAVKLIPFPSDPSKVIAVVKVLESIEAPHAIENSTKVFVRVNSTTDRITLAEMDRIEFLLSRRRDSGIRRDQMVQKAFSLSQVPLPKLRVEVGPHYPQKHIVDLGKIQESFVGLQHDPLVRILGPHTRLVQQGVINTGSHWSSYLHVNLFGQWCYECTLRVGSIKNVGGDHLDLVNITLELASFLHAASSLLSTIAANLLIRARLEGIKNRSIIEDPATLGYLLPTPQYWMDERKALQDTAEAEVNALSETFKKDLGRHVVELVRQLMWVFNWADERVEKKVLNILSTNHYIP
jgi:hypothetical protein